MRKSNQQSIGEVLKEYLRQNNLDKKILHSQVLQEWDKIVGPLFAKHTKSIWFHEKSLVLEIASPALRNELLMQRTLIIEKVNALAGEQLITEIALK